MPSSYGKTSNSQDLIFREDTDTALSSDAQLKNNTRYLYFKKVALGGKCLIQSCRDLHLGRVVCHKTLRQEFADDEQERRMFLREARVTAMLQHPNTAPVYEVGMDNKGRYYFTMKLVSGITLHEILEGLKNGDPEYTEHWDLERLVDVVIQVGQVLSYAHVHGVVHCDVKPENIVAGSFGEVLLLDWGNAWLSEKNPVEKEAQDNDRTLHSREAHPGTPQYMSPEQIEGSDIDQRTDIYSLGAILFEILTGQQLAWGNSLDEMLQNKTKSDPPPPTIVAPDRGIPNALESLCLRCVQREPEHRVRTMLKVIHELIYWLRMDAARRPV